MLPKLHRSQKDSIIGGVCGGIAETFDVDSNMIRIIFTLFTIFGAGVVIYLILWAVLPIGEATHDYKTQETYTNGNNENVNTMERDHNNIYKVKKDNKNLNLTAFILIFVGVLLLLNNLFSALNIHKLWPLLLMLIGVVILFNNNSNKK